MTPQPRYSTLSTSTDDVIDIPPIEKLPSADQLDSTFEPIDHDVSPAYKDPIKLHKMLIDERIKAQQKQVIIYKKIYFLLILL